MWPKLSRLNTLRNQMLFGFLAVMMVILTFVGGITFNSVSTLLKNNAEKHIQQTAVQTNGRLEGILDQINSLTTLVSTNGYVQQLLLKEVHGQPSTFAERQALPPIINLVQMYTDGINSIELYNKDRARLYPLDEGNLGDKVSEDWIRQANEEEGSIVWFGIDPSNPVSLLAIRRISLVDRYFSTGGYLLIRADRSKFALKDPLSDDSEAETMLLMARDGQLITSNDDSISQSEAARLTASDDQTVKIGKRSFILVKQRSSVTGWTLLILTPVDTITKGVSIVRTTIVVSACIGTILFMLLSFFLSTVITRPIFRLIKTMRGTRLGVLKPTDTVSSTIEIKELNYSYNQMVDNINELIKLVYEKELSQSRTELKALQAQIHPHFLFNTLDALYWSLLEKDEDQLAAYVVAMSDLFRYTITGPNKDEWVSLRDELEHVERYLLIMKMRFEDRLTWHIDAAAEFADVQLPKLLLQPLVENAILHGVESTVMPGRVELTVVQSGDHIVITVEDNGAGMDEEKLRLLADGLESGKVPSSKNSGVGIANVQRRLRLYFASDDDKSPAGIAIQSRKGAGTRVSITIPLNGGRTI
ncbi:sensor histidine kinase [Paenibacillus rhizovicinus]|uniref:histidine kinase n=1 Tax=Paenibacillus rhizovicinus TaxID=2704463 RepID=A0A6C0P5C9_9BACL|nr:sensor histidine kinase [Paenibacillus rhizovicinus]QHW33486.1 sensor histidine kinase [Paenibacillus rhizovicinus]